MKQRGHMVTGDSHGANPAVDSDKLVKGNFLTEEEVTKRAEAVLKRNPGKTASDLLRNS